VEDLDKAKEFAALDDLRQAMQKTGVTGNSDDYCLEPPRQAGPTA